MSRFIVVASLVCWILGCGRGAGPELANTAGALGSVRALAISPSSAVNPSSSDGQFSATATYSDGSTADVTTQVTWAASKARVATISNSPGSQGLAQCNASGQTNITATLGTLSARASLQVTSAQLLSIAVTPVNASLPAGLTQQYAATGSYSDGSTWDITRIVTWASSNTASATASNGGLVSGLLAGNSVISATLNGLTGSAPLAVEPPVLRSIVVTPASAAISQTLSLQLSAVGSFTDGSTKDITASAAWASSNAGVASISALGLAQGQSPGTATLSASLNGVTASAMLTVKSIATTYQVNAAHTGSQTTDSLTLPLTRRWSRDLGAPVSYPVVGGGAVFVAVGTSPPSLYALDQQNGATLYGPVSLGGPYPWAALAYDGGRVFALNSSGQLTAFDAASGKVLWTEQLPGQYSFSSPPTALAGVVYVSGAGSGGTLYAVSEGDGSVLWTQAVMNGDHSSPAVTAQGAYVSYVCDQAYDFAPPTGALLWHHSGPCEGGGGKTTVAFGGALYTRDAIAGNLILDAASGSQLGTYSSTYIPAFSSGNAYFTLPPSLLAYPVGSSTAAWSFGSASDPVQTAPITVGPYVVTATSTQLYVLNAADGSVASSDALVGVRTPDEQNVSAPLGGLASAEGFLFVPAGTGLVAY